VLGRSGQDRPAGPTAVAVRDDRPPERRTAIAITVAVLLALVVLVVTVAALARRAAGPQPMTPYVAPQYWLSYEDGFVRRGLPGAVLRALSGDRPPSRVLVDAAAVGLTVAAVAAVLVLAAVLSRRAGSGWTSVALAAAVVATPLGISHFGRDLGRPDALGVLVAVVLVTAPWARLPLPVAAAVVALLTTVAIGAVELLAVLVLPLGWLALRQALPDSRSRQVWPALAVLPGLVLATLSALLPVPQAALKRARADATAAGVPDPKPLPGGPADHDAVSRLGYGLVENITGYYATTSVLSVLVTTAVWASMHVLLIGVVWRLLGRSWRERAFLLLVACSAAGALALSVAGIDYRRWWALAAVGALCALALLVRSPGPIRPIGFGTAAALVALALTGLLLRTMPVLPLAPVHVQRLLQGFG
jgi:hypothetical protein